LTTKYDYVSLYVPSDKIELAKDDIIEQTIKFDDSLVECIGFGVADRTVSCTGNIQIELINDDNECVWSDSVNVDDIALKTKTWFKPDITVTPQSEYRFVISSEDLKGKIYISALETSENIEEIEDKLYKNDEQQELSVMFGITYPQHLDGLTKLIIIVLCIVASILIIGFETLFANRKRTAYTLAIIAFVAIPLLWLKRFNGTLDSQCIKLYICIMIVYFMALMISIWLYCIKKCNKVELYFIVIYALIGILYMVVLLPFSAPDEGKHFSMSYRISNKILGEKINDENGYIYMRACDSYEYVFVPGREYTIDIYEQLFDPLEDSEEIVSSNNNYYVNTYTLLYLPQSIGITLGRLMHCNSIMLLYLGRLFNYIAFAVIIFISIKIIPRGKWVVFAISQIPIVMEQTTSYSYDTYIIAFTILYVACIIYLIEKKQKALKRQLVAIFVLGIFIAPMKYVYIFFVGLVLLINNELISLSKWKAVLYKVSCIIGAILFTIFVYSSSNILHTSYFLDTVVDNCESDEILVYDYETLAYGDNTIYIDDSDYYTSFNPLRFVEQSIGTILKSGEDEYLSMFGNSLGSNEISMPFFLTLFTSMFYFMAAYGVYGNGKMELSIYQKLWIVLIGLAMVGSIYLAFYKGNYVSRSELIGIQGRYFTPILSLILFDANLNGNERKSRNELLIFGSLGIQLLVILNVILVVWMR
jgi:uncharacterized membrane protein